MQLSVICIGVCLRKITFDDIKELTRIHCEKQRTEARSLGYTIGQITTLREVIFKGNTLCSVRKIRRDPL